MPTPATSAHLPWTPTPGSSNVQGFAYDPANRLLHVRFNSGHSYVYKDVDPSVHDGLLNADSVGKFLHENVKGSYDYTRTG